MNSFMLLMAIFVPLAAGCMLPIFGDKLGNRGRSAYVTIICAVTVLMAAVTAAGEDFSLTLWSMTDELSISFGLDGLTRVFSLLIPISWTLVAVYGVKYMESEHNQSRFFSFYLIVLGMLCALSYSANLITMYLFFELMTLTSVPLVLHEMTKEAIAAAFKYLFYSVAGALFALFGVIMIYLYGGGQSFVSGGTVQIDAADGGFGLFLAAIFVTIIGFGAKAGMFPMHAWLTAAHPIAPAPASAVLSGVITKAGIICITRVVYYSVGASLLRGTWLQYAWMSVALVTVFMGSMMAYKEKLFKRRLAYSTISQVSYVMVGLAALDASGFYGAILHVIFHSAIKNGLFLAAGSFIHMTGMKNVADFRGIGKRMPVTLWSFTFLSIALVGIPPMSGFVSKWYLAMGALDSGLGALGWIAPAVLLISALLTAGYLLPVTINGFFPSSGLGEGESFDDSALEGVNEAPASMTVPVVIFAAASLALGLFAAPILGFVRTIL